jgi:CPA2 family monovalent cation:H+ antiporter-2
LLDKIKFPYVAIDFDIELVQRASLAGDEVIYGDPANPEILRKAGLGHAKILILALNENHTTVKILEMVRASHPKLPVLVRCRDRVELNQLKKIGPTHIIAEVFEASLSLSHHLLHYLNLPRNEIADIIQDIRNRDYDLLNKIFIGTQPEEDETDFDLHEQLSPITISEDAYSIGHTLSELNLAEMGAEVVAIRRGNAKHVKPRSNIKIHAGDIVIVFGSTRQLEMAERRLLEG